MTILTKEHIKSLVESFYARVQMDGLLGPVFNEVAKVDWEHHIPLLCEFWNSIMLKTNEYHGNAFLKHVEVARFIPITEKHFERWLQLFKEEAWMNLPPEHAKTIVGRAQLIASSLRRGMIHNPHFHFALPADS